MSAVEILVVLGIVALIAVPLSTFQKDVFSQNSMIQSGALAEEGTRRILKGIITELRTASPANTGAYLLAEAATSSITFYSDMNNDGVRDRIRYFLSGTSLKKGVIVPTGSPLVYVVANEKLQTMADNIINGTTTIFSYYDSNYTGTSSPLSTPVDISRVRLVGINIGIDPNPNRPLAPIWLTSSVMIRNLKDNL